MSPKDHTSDKTTDSQPQQSSSSSHTIDQIVDNIALGPQSGHRSGSQSTSSGKSEDNTQIRSKSMRNNFFGYEMPFDVISTAFASTVAIGGLIGYLKAKSTYSLIAGLVFGSVLGFGAYQTSVNPRNYYLTLGTSAVLGAFMGYRAINSGKFMPAGLIASLSALMVLRFAVRVFSDTNYMKK